jgi:hypothetical protein
MQGVCVNDPLAPNEEDCVNEDELVSRYDIAYNIDLPSTSMTCGATIQYLISIKIDYLFYCRSQDFDFGSACCKTCASNFN